MINMHNNDFQKYHIMKQNTSVLFISAIAAVMVVGAFATGGFSNSPLMIASADNTAKESPMGIYGHLELVATDSEGNIIKYIQSDNTSSTLVKTVLVNCYLM